jgi:DNA polymerase III epsilon subunit-like protein
LPAETETARQFAEFLSRHATLNIMTTRGATLRVAQLAAHHAVHDGSFLQAFFARNHRFYPGDYRMLCTVQRAQWFFQENGEMPPPADFKLATLCEYFGVPFPRAKRHDALQDVRATVELYRVILAHEANLTLRGRHCDPVRPATSHLADIAGKNRIDQEELAFIRRQRIVPRRPSAVAPSDK